MSDTVIRVENLSKKYLIRHVGDTRSGDGLRHAISDVIGATARKLRGRANSGGSAAQPSTGNHPEASEAFYALRDVSFEVKRGEVLGIIGRNGAGKSTLLKILSRITEPTSGRIGLKGRVASLLEVGTGFHAELTGRENVYLNGAILGMSRAEVKRKFDEIVDFSGVEKFLDTPVKRYSSGMYVRLAFAVAAHLEPEVLIIDEVLAVGDAEFQQKCLGKMRRIAGEGRTILFVSHNLHAVQTLCQSALLLGDGRVVQCGSVFDVGNHYLATTKSPEGGTIHIASDSFRLAGVSAKYVEVCDDEAEISIAIECASQQVLDGLHIDVGLDTVHEVRVVQLVPKVYRAPLSLAPANPLCVTYRVSVPYLRPGAYTITVYAYLQSGQVVSHVSHIPAFTVPNTPRRPESLRAGFSAILLPRFTMDVETRESVTAASCQAS